LSNLFVVDHTQDDGQPGSLRAAISQVDADASDRQASPDAIHFAIPMTDPGFSAATGQWTIAPISALPALTAPVVIDGYTQSGSTPNTNDLQHADNAVCSIALSGAAATAGANGLDFEAGSDGSTVRGLIIDGFMEGGTGTGGNGVFLAANNSIVAGCLIGFNPKVSGVPGNALAGVLVRGAGNTLGGTTPAARNVLSGNQGNGVVISGTSSTADAVQGNFIGTDASGAAARPNGGDGVLLQNTSGNTIGGPVSGSDITNTGNVISGNGGQGIEMTTTATTPPQGGTSAGSLTLTASGSGAGFSLATFATGFPSRSDGLGPFGIGFPSTGGVLVTDGAGNVRQFPTDTDGQNAANVPPTPGAPGLAEKPSGIAKLGNLLYMTLGNPTDGEVV
jgi:hypothetical protein